MDRLISFLLIIIVAVPLSYVSRGVGDVQSLVGPFFAVAVSWWPCDFFKQDILVWLTFLVLPCDQQ